MTTLQNLKAKFCVSKLIILAAGLVLLLASLFGITFVNVNAIDNSTKSFANATNYVLTRTWGSHGEEDGQFIRPHDLDFSPSEDKLYVVDRNNNRIQVFNKNGTFLFKWGSLGQENGELSLPYGVDVDTEGNVWVADRNNSRVQKFDSQGKFQLKFGTFGNGTGQFDNLRHVAVDNALKFVYVADSLNSRIQVFDINGKFIKSFGKYGNDSGEFSLPATVVIDSNGNLYVNERRNERVQKVDAEGNTILMWGSKGSGQSQFCHVEHLGIDKFDNIYVTDPQSDEGCSHKAAIKKFDKNGKFITAWKVEGNGTDIDPEHLAIDSEGNVYVSERSNDQIQVYTPVQK